MYPEQLEKSGHYRFTNEQVFKGASELVRGFVERDYSVGMHEQEFFEINVVLSGRGLHYIENRRIPAKSGDVFIIPPDTAHGYAGEEGFDVYHLLLSQSFMQKYMTDLQKLPSFFILFKAEPLMRTGSSTPFYLQLTHPQLKKIEELLQKIKDYTERQTVSATVIRNSLAMIVIISFCEIHTQNTGTADCQNTQHDTAFANALAFIYEHYNEQIHITDLSKIAQLSRSSFVRKFHEICKMPPAKFITQQRVEAAKHLLLHTDLSVSDIAVKTGFYDTSHFIKVFTTEIKMTPNAYRKEYSKKRKSLD